jgi:rhodanese-related sulfurtransferase
MRPAPHAPPASVTEAVGDVDLPPEPLRTLPVGTLRIHGYEPVGTHGPPGHLSDSGPIPLAGLELAAASCDRSPPVLRIFRSGARSARAAMARLQMGFKQRSNLVRGRGAVRTIADGA